MLKYLICVAVIIGYLLLKAFIYQHFGDDVLESPPQISRYHFWVIVAVLLFIILYISINPLDIDDRLQAAYESGYDAGYDAGNYDGTNGYVMDSYSLDGFDASDY